MASISQRQVDLLRSKFLNSLGGNRDQFINFGGNKSEVELPVVEGIIEQAALAFLEEANSNIDKAGSVYKGNMSSDLTFTVENTGSSYIINIGYNKDSIAAKYYDFVNKGVNGVEYDRASPYSFKTKYPNKKMATALLLWLRGGANAARNEDQVDNLSPLQIKRQGMLTKLRQSDDFKGLAYAISTSIKKKGIKATHFFDDAISTVFNDNFRMILSEALAADVQIQLTNTRLN